jgi:hypothetical protein
MPKSKGNRILAHALGREEEKTMWDIVEGNLANNGSNSRPTAMIALFALLKMERNDWTPSYR